MILPLHTSKIISIYKDGQTISLIRQLHHEIFDQVWPHLKGNKEGSCVRSLSYSLCPASNGMLNILIAFVSVVE